MAKFLGPYFIKPTLREEVYPDFSMFVELEKLFSKIVPGSLIRGALYMWNEETGIPRPGYRHKWRKEPGNPLFVTNHFLANAGDCDTKIILDNYSSKYHKQTLKHLILHLGGSNIIIDTREGENDPEYRRKLAERFELAKTGYMHDKFFLISELEGIGRHVIIQLTANINVTQCHQFNNMLVIYDDAPLFERYLEHWESIKNTIQARMKGNKVLNPITIPDPEFDEKTQAQVFFFPRKTPCPIEQELRKILNDEPSSRVRIDIAMAYMTRHGIRNLLLRLKHEGCKIRVLLSEEYQNIGEVAFFKENKIKCRVVKNKKYNTIPYLLQNGRHKVLDNWQARMHNKFVLIEKDHHKITWSGSYNLTIPGLKLNDESVLRVCDKNVFLRYRKMFNMLWYPEGELPKLF